MNFWPWRASVRAFFEAVVCFFGTGCSVHGDAHAFAVRECPRDGEGFTARAPGDLGLALLRGSEDVRRAAVRDWPLVRARV
ncbi:hypothetical protein GCM10010363_61070 [Streptomyces omiyaensis]|nr:hypothetical protein GCM10010363_61070 [Streptomyces omiyaensis]